LDSGELKSDYSASNHVPGKLFKLKGTTLRNKKDNGLAKLLASY